MSDDIIDLKINLYCQVGLDDEKVVLGTFLKQWTDNLVVKQYGTDKSKISLNLINMAIAIIIIIFIRILVKFLYFNINIWEIYNIFGMLAGMTTYKLPNKVSERIFFIYLLFINCILLNTILQELVNSVLMQKLYLNLKTVDDLNQTKIIPYITKPNKETTLIEDNPALRDLLLKSRTIDTYTKIGECIARLTNDDPDVEACEAYFTVGNFLKNNFVETENKWIITLVDEPILYGWNTMSYSNSSPYIRPFDSVLRRYWESGLFEYLENFYLRDYAYAHKHIFKMKQLKLSNLKLPSISNIKVSSQKQILEIFMCALCIPFVAFICEVILRQIQIKLQNNSKRQCF